MPLPPPSFTLVRWTAFFAELSSKLSHHHPLVVLEGCDVVRRLLVSHLSIAVFLQESSTLQSLLHTLTVSFQQGPQQGSVAPSTAAGGKSSLPSTIQEEDISLSILGTLSMILYLMRSLLAEGDAYYSALVLSQAGAVLEALVVILHSPHHCGFGWTAYLVGQLLDMFTGAPRLCSLREQLSNLLAERSQPVTIHVQRVLDGVALLPDMWRRLPIQLSVVVTHTTGPPQLAAQSLLSRAERLVSAIPTPEDPDALPATPSKTNTNSLPNEFSGLAPDYTLASQLDVSEAESGSDETPCTTAANASVTIHMTPMDARRGEESGHSGAAAVVDEHESSSSSNRQSGHCSEQDESTRPASVEPNFQQLCASILVSIGVCRSHQSFLSLFHELWCVTTACVPAVLEAFTPALLESSLKRYVTTPPANRRDYTVFSTALHWLSELLYSPCLRPSFAAALEDALALPLLSLAAKHAGPTDANTTESAPHQRYSTLRAADDVATRWEEGLQLHSAAGSAVPASDVLLLYPTVAHQKQVAMLRSTPSLAPLLLSFLHFLQMACAPRRMVRWVEEGSAFRVVMPLLTAAAERQTPLLHAPSEHVDASLCDEVYLRWSRAEAGDCLHVAAMLACRLVAGLCRGVTWSGVSPPMCYTAGLQAVVPLLAQVSQQHPTLALPHASTASDVLYHARSDFHFARYGSLGECAVYALDTCLWSSHTLQLHCVDVESLLPMLPEWLAATQQSIHHAVRAVPVRCLMYVTRTPTQLRAVLSAVPHIILRSVRAVLAYSSTGSQWEAGAAAEWLLHVLTHLQERHEVRDALVTTALPSQLLDVLLTGPVNYTTSRLLRLAVLLAPHTTRHSGVSVEGEEGVESSAVSTQLSEEEPPWIGLAPKATAIQQELRRYLTARRTSPILSPANITVEWRGAPSRSKPAQWMGVLESVAAGWSYTAALLCGLSRTIVKPLHQRDAIDLLQSTFAAPTPDEVRRLVSAQFECDTQDEEDEDGGEGRGAYRQLTEAYHEMMVATCHWASTQFRRRSLLPHLVGEPTFATFWLQLAQRMGDERIDTRTRAVMPEVVSSRLSHMASHSEETLPHAAKLFLATLTLPPTPRVVATQCRLVFRLPEACEACVNEGTWVERCLTELEDSLMANREVLASGTHQPHQLQHQLQRFVMALSAVSCVLASPQCPVPPQLTARKVAVSLVDGLRLSVTRIPTLKALRSLAASRVGYRCLLQELSRGGRTVFGLLISMLFETCSDTWCTGDGVNLRGSMKKTSPLLGHAPVTSTHQLLCYEVCVNACRAHVEEMVVAVQRYKALTLLCNQLEKWDRLSTMNTTHSNASGTQLQQAALQWLACMSLQSELRQDLFSRASCISLLVEQSGGMMVASGSSREASEAELQQQQQQQVSLLSLLVLRNGCFSSHVRDAICYDVRIIVTLKAALLFMDTVAPLVVHHFDSDAMILEEEVGREGDKKGGRQTGLLHGKVASSWAAKVQMLAAATSEKQSRKPVLKKAMSAIVRLRRHALAVTALWALLDEQRNNTTVRRVMMRMDPAVNWVLLRQQSSAWCRRCALETVSHDGLSTLVEYPVEDHLLTALDQLEKLLTDDG